MDLTLSFLLGAVVTFVVYLVNCHSYWAKHGIPISKGMVPLVGHMLPLLTLRTNMTHICAKMYKDKPNASMIGFYKLTRPALLIREPELVKTVLQSSFTSFHDNGVKINPSIDPLLAKNPFFANREDWVSGRKRLNYAFSGARLKILFESVNGVCKKFVDFLEDQLNPSDKYEVELKQLFTRFTGEVVANVGFGIEGQCFKDEAQSFPFQRIGKSIFEPGFWVLFVKSMSFFIPEISKLFKTRFISKDVDSAFRTLVHEVLESRKHDPVPRNDFLQLMMNLEKTEGEKLNEEVLAGYGLSFFLDGYETSGITLSFVGYHIAANQDIQRKLREEVMAVLSNHNGTLTYESLREMTYLDQVISESQRRYVVIGSLVKICTQECELRGSDGLCVRVKPGAEIFLPVQSLHMDSNHWIDPETFDPERFNEDRKQHIKKFAYLPFGDGPRMCVGMRIAMLQMKACMATLVKSYTLELSPKTKLPITLAPHHFISTPIGGLWAYVKRI